MEAKGTEARAVMAEAGAMAEEATDRLAVAPCRLRAA